MKIKLTEEDLRKLVRDVINEVIDYPPFIKNTWDYERGRHITEGLTCTYNYGKVMRILRRKFDFNSLGIMYGEFDHNDSSETSFWDVKRGKTDDRTLYTTRDSDNWVKFELYFKRGYGENQNIVKEIIQTCDACGWFYAGYGIYGKNNDFDFIKGLPTDDETYKTRPFKLYFRAKFNAECKREKLPKYLYHICPYKTLNKVMSQGLKPMAGGRQEHHPERVYLYLDKPSEMAFAEILGNFKKRKVERYALLRVDTDRINENTNFYFDSNTYFGYPKAVYTLEPIPGNAIEILYVEKKKTNNFKDIS